MAQPDNINYLSPLGFRLIFDKLPTVSYMCKTVELPSLTMNEIAIGYPPNMTYEPGDKLIFEPLVVRFQVDEDMVNYIEIFDWMIGLGWPERSKQHTDRITYNLRKFERDEQDVFSDFTLQILSSHKNLNKSLKFKRGFPTSLSPLSFDSSLSDVNYIEADLTIRYLDYTIT